MINDENASPFRSLSEVSMSINPSEPPSSPLVSNSFLYNLPDPTLGIPTTSTAGRLDILPSPFKRSAIASLNQPLSHEQTQQLLSHKANAVASRSPSKALSPGRSTRLQANLNAPGGLPTPPSSSEALTTTPRSAAHVLAPLPQEPVSPSPSRTRNAASPSKPSRPASTPSQSQRTPTRRTLRADNGAESSDDDDILRSAGGRTPKRMQSLKEFEEDSDQDEEEEEEEEIQLVSFKRGGPDATFIREIKENGWDQPLPPSPIKFTYLEPVAPRPPRQSSVGARARSQSRSKTPQTRASPAPSHASSSRASNRARSVRASSAAAADQTNDNSDESIKSSGSALTHLSRVSQARSKASSSGRRSIARSSVAPPVLVADLTRDHPSLPDSPGDDPLLMTGPDTYIVYHDQTPSAKNRSTSRVSKPGAGQPDASLSMHAHSTPLPTAAAAAASQRRDSTGSASSSASRSSLYTRMSGRQATHVSAVDEHDQDESQRTEHASAQVEALFDGEDAQQEHDDGAAFLPFDDAGFASDSDHDESAPAAPAGSSSSGPVQETGQAMEDVAEGPELQDISSMSDVSRSFVDDSAVRDSAEVSGPVDVTATDASQDNDDSAIIDPSLHHSAVDQSMDVSAADPSMDASLHDHSESINANDTSLEDRTMDTSAADDSAHIDHSDEISANEPSLDASASESLTDLSSSNDAAADASVADQSIIVHAIDESMDASVNDQSVNTNADSSAALSEAGDTSVEQTREEAEASDVSVEAVVAETSVVADETLDSHLESSIGQEEVDASEALDNSRVSDGTPAFDDSQVSDGADLVEHDLSVRTNVSEAGADASFAEHSAVEQSESHIATTLPAELASNSINLDISLPADATGTSIAAPPIDGALLPHPVVLIETLPEDSSAILAWKAHQAACASDISRADSADITANFFASIVDKEAGDVSMADAVDARAVATQDAAAESSALPRSNSVASILSTLSSVGASEQEDEDEEAFRQKYQSSRDTVVDRSTVSRRLSLSSDSEHESEVEEQHDDDQDAQDADESASRLDASQSRRAHSHVTEHDDELEDEEEEEIDDESAVSDEAASGGEEDDSQEEEEEEEEDEEDVEEAVEEMSEDDEADAHDDDDASSTHSQLDEDEQSASRLEPVVILSSSASPSLASSSRLQSHDDSEDEDSEYVISVVRDSRDRSVRASEHSAIDDEPAIHTLHLRQPAPRPSFAADTTTPGDASHSRSRVLKLGQATSTPIVEISSLDPRAAARATAILKLFHKYVDEGWLSGAEMGDATEGRMRRVVDAIQNADRRGRRLEDASELQQLSVAASEREGADLTTLLMDAELALAREGTGETESFLGSRATSVASAGGAGMASPATPFLPGGFRATPATAGQVAAATDAGHTASPSMTATSRSNLTGVADDTTAATANQSKRKHPTTSTHSFAFPGLSTPDRSSARRPPAKQARLSAALAAPTLDTFNPRIWDTADWVRLDKYLTCGVKKIASHMLASSRAPTRALKARSYVDALLGIDVAHVAALFLDEMRITDTRRVGEWTPVKVEQRLLALQRKYLRKVEGKYARVLEGEGGDASVATEDLDWSLGGSTTGESAAVSGGRGRVSFGTPYRMGAHSTPAVGLLKKATSRAAKERAQQEQRTERMYPPLPDTSSTTQAADEEGVMTKASRFISRLSGSFGGLLASPRPSSVQGGDKGKRKATDAELEPSPRIARRRVDNSIAADRTASTASGADSTDSLLSAAGARSANASMLTNATSIRPDASSARKTTQPRLPAVSSSVTTARSGTGAGGRVGLTSSLQLAGGSSGVSHTPLSLLSPATHRVAARKVDELRHSRALRNWTSPRRQRLLLRSTTTTTATNTSTSSGRRGKGAAPRVSTSSSGRDGSGRDGSMRDVSSESGSASLAEIITSDAARAAVKERGGRAGRSAGEGSRC
ncbi:conserved hypothetical protein [Sporisorium reilianum SRZ2]|uniref:Uncharacterized protein n=1 Tax=Sporisorium reilianum (strain SRZ2) TaxID=999809 RepID=E6ZQ52_SPORE|nr:conserved hypothetical protein [Sporisorium reilianum SRZ2]